MGAWGDSESDRKHRNDLRRCRESEGGKWEIQVLGRCSFAREGRCPKYSTFNTALRASKRHQYYWNPARPATEVGWDLFSKVAYEIWERTGVVCESLRFFVTLGGPADRYHGVDCYLEIEGGKSVVLIDLTDNAEKIDPRGEAYVFFRPSDLDSGDPLHPVGPSFVKHVVDTLLDPTRSICIQHEGSQDMYAEQDIDVPEWVQWLSDPNHPYPIDNTWGDNSSYNNNKGISVEISHD
jgi:hypothetical protein